MIGYLLDSSALWRLLRDDELHDAWTEIVGAGAVRSCGPQRTEFLRSARDIEEYERITAMFGASYPDAPVPKGVWRWIDTAQYRLVRAGAHQSASAVDLMISATAAIHGLTVLHDDSDFVTVARHVPDLSERRV